ncbi:fam-b protein [Plasmodium vinckei lentum]|uniref:Fam-b protein n=1 Tax=Plasmodium vinckei lentum TaxID=138297 RepID=A0A6V7SN82_PLAVN|nr:fam-b protein [Plasmodium vinckei lentum]
MKPGILKFVFFSIIICSFEYAKNELYYVNERRIYLERNIINFRNNRILADRDSQFDLNNFYESTLSLTDQLNDCNDGDKNIINIRNLINSHIKKYKESNKLPNLNNVDEKTRREIHELQKELGKVKKELDSIRNDKLAIQPIQDKRITKKDDTFEEKYNEITSSKKYEKRVIDQKLKKAEIKFVVASLTFIVSLIMILASGGPVYLILSLTPCAFFICKSFMAIDKLSIKKLKILNSHSLL